MNAVPIEAPALAPRRGNAPYSHKVAAELARGRVPNCFLFTGTDAWERAARRRERYGPASALVLPPGADPAGFQWPPVNALFVDARELSRADAVRLGSLLIADGIRYVAMLAARDEPLNFWRAGRKA